MHRFIALALFLALTACVSASHNSLVERGEAGDAAAQFELGKSYARGAGVKQDFAIAENWFAKAAVTDPVYIGRIIDFYGDDLGDLERSVAWLGEKFNHLLARTQSTYRFLGCLFTDKSQSRPVNQFARRLAAADLGEEGAKRAARFWYLRATETERMAANALADRCVKSVREGVAKMERLKLNFR